jgi:Fur family ferric uptake transcriptional regulator
MGRRTQQREAIDGFLRKAGRPVSPREIFQGAGRRVSGLGMATVYRALRAMLDEGRVVHVKLPGQPDRYEMAGKGHHHHFSCRSCGRVFELEGCPGEMSGLLPPGFRADAHEVVLYGRCASCAPRRARRG